VKQPLALAATLRRQGPFLFDHGTVSLTGDPMHSNAIQSACSSPYRAGRAATCGGATAATTDNEATMPDFFLAGGTLSWPFIAGSLLLTNISASRSSA
jgi:hypothetical protein